MDNFDPQKVYTDAIELYQNKKYRESIKLFNKILKYYPNHSKTYNNLGVIHKELEEFKEAKIFFMKAVEYDQDYIIALNN